MTTGAEAARRAVEAVWRIESARIIAGLAGLVSDVGLAEELAQDALVAALEQWPARASRPTRAAGSCSPAGIARSTGSGATSAARQAEPARPGGGDGQLASPPEFDAVIDDDAIDDDLLRLMFISCHPVLSTEARIALTLRLLGGLTTEEIARGFLVPEPTIAKRITRAKRTLAEAACRSRCRPAADLPARLSSVLDVLYLVFNEGYSAMAGDDGCARRSAARRCASAACSPG